MNPFSIYFPQFYATPTNDEAWGKGFSDWSLVANANMHRRWARRAPRRGFYDGSDSVVHAAQIQEMREARLGGLALYHYWFYSHQELAAAETSLLRMPAGSGLPWFLIWASEGWSRRWLGDPTPIVTLAAEPTPADIDAHCQHLMRCFEHPDYFRWQGKPLFVWYHLGHFANAQRTVEQYRQCWRRHGVDVAVGHFVKNPFDAELAGLADISYLFEPRLFFGMQRNDRGGSAKRAFDAVRRITSEDTAQRLLTTLDRVRGSAKTYGAAEFLNYLSGQRRKQLIASLPGIVQDVVSPGWNNTPRYEDRFTCLQDLEPDVFGSVLREAAARVAPPPLINAWNEWSEGAAIEPCAYLGTRYLDALRG